MRYWWRTEDNGYRSEYEYNTSGACKADAEEVCKQIKDTVYVCNSGPWMHWEQAIAKCSYVDNTILWTVPKDKQFKV